LIRFCFLFFSVYVFVTDSITHAAEIRNIQTGQTARQAYIQYDLIGKPGEKEAEVIVKLEVEGKLYNSDKLALTGDLGKKVKVGTGKRIWWEILKDMPAGLTDEIVWDIETSTIINDGFFEVSPYTVTDISSNLTWAKLDKSASEKTSYSQALKFIKIMNSRKFGGFSDWRLPERAEAKKLFVAVSKAHAANGKSAIQKLRRYFPKLENWNYWLQTDGLVRGPNVGPFGYLVSYHFDIERGEIGHSRKDESLCVLPVRGSKDNSGNGNSAFDDL